MVVKRDGRREPFDIRKIERGIRITTEKRNIGQEKIEEVLQDIEDEVQILAGAKREISSAAIGEAALRQLYRIDTVAYVRFASVYRAFDNVDQFIQEIERITNNME
jgi:transcriptional repressor NrdR